MLDLKDKYVDLDVLRILSESVQKNLKDGYDVSIYKYKQKILELFGRISSLVVNNWKIYWYYAEIVLVFGQLDEQNNKISLSKESADKYFGLLQKAFRNLYNQNNWETTVETCKEVINQSTEILKSNWCFLLYKTKIYLNIIYLLFWFERVHRIWKMFRVEWWNIWIIEFKHTIYYNEIETKIWSGHVGLRNE